MMANTAVGSAIGFLFWLAAARAMSPAQVGLGSAYVAAVLFIATLAELGLGTVVIRFAAGMDAAMSRRFINSAMTAVGISTACASLLFALGTPLWSPELYALATSPSALALFALVTVISALGQFLDRVFVAFERSGFLLARNVLLNSLRLIVVVAIGRAFGAWALVLALLIGGATSLLLAWGVFSPKILSGFRPRPALELGLLREHVRYTLSNHIAQLLWAAPTLLYPLMIVGLLGPEANARFYVSWMIANLLFVTPASVFTVALARAANRQPDARAYRRTVGLTLLGLAPAVAVLLGVGPMVLRIFGSSYAGEDSLFQLLVLSVFPYTITTALVAHHRITLKAGRLVWQSAAIAGLALGLSAVMAGIWGLNGVGLGWLAGHAAGSLLALEWVLPSSRHRSTDVERNVGLA
jgi:O-antigen/teichoic acid export membrane protein